MRKTCLTVAAALLIVAPSAAQRGQSAAAADGITILKPARVWDGDTMHEGWSVRVKGERIDGSDRSRPPPPPAPESSLCRERR